LGRELEAFTDRPGGGEIEDEGEDLHLGAAEGAEQRIDLVDAADELGQLSRELRVNSSSSCLLDVWLLTPASAALTEPSLRLGLCHPG
jgi:hypothetical protein